MPEHDDNGSPVPSAGYLYKVCVYDFQQFIAEIRALMQ